MSLVEWWTWNFIEIKVTYDEVIASNIVFIGTLIIIWWRLLIGWWAQTSSFTPCFHATNQGFLIQKQACKYVHFYHFYFFLSFSTLYFLIWISIIIIFIKKSNFKFNLIFIKLIYKDRSNHFCIKIDFK